MTGGRWRKDEGDRREEGSEENRVEKRGWEWREIDAFSGSELGGRRTGST